MEYAKDEWTHSAPVFSHYSKREDAAESETPGGFPETHLRSVLIYANLRTRSTLANLRIFEVLVLFFRAENLPVSHVKTGYGGLVRDSTSKKSFKPTIDTGTHLYGYF